jgi:hypothetical protein
MLLSPAVDAQIRQRFVNLITKTTDLEKRIVDDNRAEQAKPRRRDDPFEFAYSFEIHHQEENYESFRVNIVSFIQMLFGQTPRGMELIEQINGLGTSSRAMRQIRGILSGLKEDYEAGMLKSLHEHIEANVSSDYMAQAEQLLGEGITGQYDYVPAAVLAGAVLERSLRTLCLKQSPQISLTNPNGSPKTLDPLIADLQKANVFNKAKADLLRSWAKTRNSAAHGEFTQFNRSDVELMITGVKTFLADYL